MPTEKEIREELKKLLGDDRFNLLEHILKRSIPEEDTILAYFPFIRPGDRYEINLITTNRFIKVGIEQDLYFYKACYINRFTWMTERYLVREDMAGNFEEFKKQDYPVVMTVEVFFDVQNDDFSRQFMEAETLEQQVLLKEFLTQFNIVALKTGPKYL